MLVVMGLGCPARRRPSMMGARCAMRIAPDLGTPLLGLGSLFDAARSQAYCKAIETALEVIDRLGHAGSLALGPETQLSGDGELESQFTPRRIRDVHEPQKL